MADTDREDSQITGVVKVSEVQMVLIRVMTRCSVLVTVSICTSFLTTISVGLRGLSNTVHWGDNVRATLVACQLFGYVLDFVINILCIMLQFEFWGKTRYKFYCSWIDGICLRSFREKAVVVVEKRRGCVDDNSSTIEVRASK